jgi:hypothetical protein
MKQAIHNLGGRLDFDTWSGLSFMASEKEMSDLKLGHK